MPAKSKRKALSVRALRRACREQIGQARATLQRSGRPASIHGARKGIKKVRAILRLMSNGSGHDSNRKTAKALRKAAGCLAAARDARVMLRAFERLAGSAAGQFPELHRRLRKRCRREAHRLKTDEALARAVSQLRKADRKFDSLEIDAGGWKLFEPGLKRSVLRAREMFDLVRSEPLAENFHEWRKGVKYLWHQIVLLGPALSGAGRVLKEELEELGNLLGEAHDLDLLKEFTAGEKVPVVERRAILRLISLRQRLLRRDGLKLGAKVLRDDDPEDICARVRGE